MMILDLEKPSYAPSLDLHRWAAAEVLDTPMPDGLTIRALVCRLGPAKWQWTITSMDRGEGELICAGIEKSVLDARLIATAEVAKCLESPIG